jgi:hypothetical protein
MLRRVVRRKQADVSEEHITSIFGVEEKAGKESIKKAAAVMFQIIELFNRQLILVMSQKNV